MSKLVLDIERRERDSESITRETGGRDGAWKREV